jgi:hypothetical protein
MTFRAATTPISAAHASRARIFLRCPLRKYRLSVIYQSLQLWMTAQPFWLLRFPSKETSVKFRSKIEGIPSATDNSCLYLPDALLCGAFF